MDISCNNGDVRLVGGINELEGQVEICYNKIWGSICHNIWSNYDANVVCKQLGHQPTGLKKSIILIYFVCFVLKVQQHYYIVILVMISHLTFLIMLNVTHLVVITLSYNVLMILYLLLSIVEMVL